MSEFSIVILNTKEKKSNTVIYFSVQGKKTFKPIISYPSNSYLKIRSKLRILTDRWDLRLFSLETLGEGQSVSSVTQSYPALREAMGCSTLGFPVHHQLLEFAQTHVHRVRDAIQPSHPLPSPSPLLLPSILPRIRVFSQADSLPLCHLGNQSTTITS